jgi:hypothetical protein
MALPESNPDLYQHVRVVISIIVGLCVTTLLSGFSRFVQHPKRDKVSMLHLGWAALLLLSIIHFWWWEFRLALVQQWTFAIYFFVILYAILFYSLCTLLFPSDLKDYSGYEEYFLSRRKWFFGLLAATFIADIIDTSLKGSAYLHSFGRLYHPNRHRPRHLRYRTVHEKPAHSTHPAGRLTPLPNGLHRPPLQHRVKSFRGELGLLRCWS